MNKPRTVMLLTRDMQGRCFSPDALKRIAAVTDLEPAGAEEITKEGQIRAAAGAIVLITGWGTKPLTPDLLDAAPCLKLVCHAAGSVRHLGVDMLRTRGVRVSSARAALARGVAEFALGMMLASMKAVWQFRDATRAGRWEREGLLDWVREPFGAVVGIIGASHTGREMIRLCKTLPLDTILLYDPYVSEEEAGVLGVEKVELNVLMRRSDVVSLHTPATEETRHLINAEYLALLKDRAIFINTARGACVDETALIAELEKGRILACLDVTDPEPPAPDSPLYQLPNCILTPHIAGAIKENMRMQGELVAGEVEAFVAGRPLQHEVDLAQSHRIA